MKKLYYVLNGPNLNMLGTREPEHYGNESYGALKQLIKSAAKELGVKVRILQTNHEGALVDKIQEAYFKNADGIVINPGAYTHTSIALLDALKATKLPAVEVHISKVEDREEFRQVSFIRGAVKKTISGHGILGYKEALEFLVNN